MMKQFQTLLLGQPTCHQITLSPLDKYCGWFIITFTCSLCHCRGLHHVLTTKGHRRGHFCVILLKHGETRRVISDAAVFALLYFWLILLIVSITLQSYVSGCFHSALRFHNAVTLWRRYNKKFIHHFFNTVNLNVQSN